MDTATLVNVHVDSCIASEIRSAIVEEESTNLRDEADCLNRTMPFYNLVICMLLLIARGDQAAGNLYIGSHAYLTI